MKYEDDGVAVTDEQVTENQPAGQEAGEENGEQAEEQKATGPATRKPARVKKKPEGVNFRDIEKYHTTEQLVEAYNEMVQTAVDLGIPKVATVSMFASVDIGAKACEQLHGLIVKARQKTGKRARAAGSKSAQDTTEESGMATKKRTGKSKSKANARKSVKSKTTAATGSRPRLDEAKKIVWSGKDIPYRGGRKERADVVRKHNGKTVGTFLEHGGNSQTLRNCVKAGLAKLA